MRPQPASSMSGSAAWAQRKLPVRLTAEHALPQLDRGLQERRALGRAGVVDEDRDRPALGARLREGRGHGLGVGHVGRRPRHGRCPAASRPRAAAPRGRVRAGCSTAPSAARVRAISAPMPRAAPVTSAWRPVNGFACIPELFSPESILAATTVRASAHQPPAVEVQRGAGHEGGGRRGQVDHRRGHLFRLAEAPERDAGAPARAAAPRPSHRAPGCAPRPAPAHSR